MICNDLFIVSSLVLTINYLMAPALSPNVGIFSQFSLQTGSSCTARNLWLLPAPQVNKHSLIPRGDLSNSEHLETLSNPIFSSLFLLPSFEAIVMVLINELSTVSMK